MYKILYVFMGMCVCVRAFFERWPKHHAASSSRASFYYYFYLQRIGAYYNDNEWNTLYTLAVKYLYTFKRTRIMSYLHVYIYVHTGGGVYYSNIGIYVLISIILLSCWRLVFGVRNFSEVTRSSAVYIYNNIIIQCILSRFAILTPSPST